MQMTTRSSFGTTFHPFYLGSLSHLNEAPMRQGFDVMVTRRTPDVTTLVFLLLFATHKEFATVAALPTTHTDAQLLVICIVAGLHCRKTSASGLCVIWTSSSETGTAVVWVVVAGMVTLVVIGFETPRAEVRGARVMISWPEREQLWKTMPMCFQYAFGKKVTVVIDCFEVFIDHPSNLLARAQTFSTYKHHNTIKVLIGITPQGPLISTRQRTVAF